MLSHNFLKSAPTIGLLTALTVFSASFACGGGQSAGRSSSQEIPPLSGSTKTEPLPPAKHEGAALQALRAQTAQFVPVDLQTDLTTLSEGERKVLSELIEAARHLDPIFDRQVFHGYAELREKIEEESNHEGPGAALSSAQLEYFDIMRGPWDRQDHFKGFAIERDHPKGAGFYPEGLSADEFSAYLRTHPNQKDALESLVTVVSRQGAALVALPYSEVYKPWLEQAAAKLESAATRTKNASLQRFLRSRAAAFRSDDYYQSDKDWMDLDSRVEITIGPYETYEDKLMGIKGSFEAFVTVSDVQASEDLMIFKELLPEMERHLPIDDAVKNQRGAESPIRVVDLVFSSGDARKSVQTIAFNLPNDERVRQEKGAKKVMLRNAINTKFTAIMVPIAKRVIVDHQLKFLDQDAFFNEVLFHELSHSLGPAFVGNDESKGEVKSALGASYAALEEGKADVMGAYNVLYMIEKGKFPKDFRKKLLLSYFAGLFRSVRFGVAEAHGKGAAMQINRFIEDGAAKRDAVSGKYIVDFDRLEASITRLVKDVCMWQHQGDKAVVDSMFMTYGKLSVETSEVLAGLTDVPVDIRPRYPVAGE